MSTALPSSTDFTGSSVTEGGFKTAITAMRTFLADLLGTTGVVSDALTALGVYSKDDVQKGIANYATGAGTANAITASITSALTALTNGMRVRIRAVGANTVSNPSFTLTLGATSTGTKTIVKGSNKALALGDIDGSSHELDLEYNSTLDKWVLLNPALPVKLGKQTVWIPAGAMSPRADIPAVFADRQSVTNKIQMKVLDFDKDTNQAAHFTIAMPKGWDEGTVKYIPIWTADAGAGVCRWELSAVAMSDDDVIDAALGTAVAVEDTLTATGDVDFGAESAAVTIAGTPAAEDLVVFEIKRNAAHANDTLSATSRLIGVKLLINFDAGDDS